MADYRADGDEYRARLQSHRAVNYRQAVTGSRERCRQCVMYRPPAGELGARCTLVERPISPDGVCDRFEAR